MLTLLLHALQVADGLAAAEILRAEDPDGFAVLAKTNVEWLYSPADGRIGNVRASGPGNVRASGPVIKLDPARWSSSGEATRTGVAVEGHHGSRAALLPGLPAARFAPERGACEALGPPRAWEVLVVGQLEGDPRAAAVRGEA